MDIFEQIKKEIDTALWLPTSANLGDIARDAEYARRLLRDIANVL